ncbi:Protein kinase domain [Dillenia turbinata]|uniref:Protein kinase domain n=1 Tax=Dillenia turbinata TaxID=194707 RepID=A0AAN8VPI2_9MAGN
MLSRAFTKPKRSPKHGERRSESNSIKSSANSIHDEYDDIIVGFMEDQPLNMICHYHHQNKKNDICCGGNRDHDRVHDHEEEEARVSFVPTLRAVLRSSVCVMGESPLGFTEKVVLLEGKICAVKRFRKLSVKRKEFGRRIEHLAHISSRCEYLIPVTAYLYTKRIKFVICDYYPMGSLSDLLLGARKDGHTYLNWNQRLMIIVCIARAIAFIHSQSPSPEKRLQLNVHGNIKSSNVMINVDFTARLSDYGYTQVADRVELDETPQQRNSQDINIDHLSQKSDIYNFGMIVLDILGGERAQQMRSCLVEKRSEIREGVLPFFEFPVEGKERKWALEVLDIGLACTNMLAEPRPNIEKILLALNDVLSNRQSNRAVI